MSMFWSLKPKISVKFDIGKSKRGALGDYFFKKLI